MRRVQLLGHGALAKLFELVGRPVVVIGGAGGNQRRSRLPVALVSARLPVVPVRATDPDSFVPIET
jgi:hypothetical protein